MNRLVALVGIGARHLHHDRHLREDYTMWTFAECPERDCRIAREAAVELKDACACGHAEALHLGRLFDGPKDGPCVCLECKCRAYNRLAEGKG